MARMVRKYPSKKVHVWEEGLPAALCGARVTANPMVVSHLDIQEMIVCDTCFKEAIVLGKMVLK